MAYSVQILTKKEHFSKHKIVCNYYTQPRSEDRAYKHNVAAPAVRFIHAAPKKEETHGNERRSHKAQESVSRRRRKVVRSLVVDHTYTPSGWNLDSRGFWRLRGLVRICLAVVRGLNSNTEWYESETKGEIVWEIYNKHKIFFMFGLLAMEIVWGSWLLNYFRVHCYWSLDQCIHIKGIQFIQFGYE